MLWVYRLLWQWNGSTWVIASANVQKENASAATASLAYPLQPGPPFKIAQMYVYLPSNQWHLFQDVGNWQGGPNKTDLYTG